MGRSPDQSPHERAVVIRRAPVRDETANLLFVALVDRSQP